jgi:hypothetical protein
MKATIVKQFVRTVAVLVAALVMLGEAKPAQAATCFADLRDCYGMAAARQGGVWDMWAAGLDCELTFTDCARRAIIGR